MKNVFVSLFMAGVLVTTMSSCRSSKDAAMLSSINGEWNIIEINGVAVVPSPNQAFPFISFDTTTGKVSGNSGCNRMMGSFDVNAKPGTIDLGTMASTRMMCPDMTLEQNVLSTLRQVKKYKELGKENIALCGSSRRPVIVLQKKTPTVKLSDLNGKWMIVEAGGQAIPEGMEKQPFIEFNLNEKRIHGNAGCNLINGDFVADSEKPSEISFSQLITTMMACPNMEVESRVLKALDDVQSFGQLEGRGIGLYDADNVLVMVLIKK
ncbi:META domain-containing protein [uncultured Bacteroides sp.]|uniref:META domain-containing protein n=1 Tax=uncultured Bacteroides sp. TaxID=162156 RepID=UPI0025DFB59A|nr:META domain-containing protein [uncultured Bacteroides sp.]